MRDFLVVFVFLTLIGCVSPSPRNNSGKEMIERKQLLSVKEEQLAQKDEEIKKLRELLAQKEVQLKEKDAKIEELKVQLRTFGVF